jgi:DNA mismatch repair protein MutS
MSFQSILFRDSDGLARSVETCEQPAFFRDLNLDQIVETITCDFGEYRLAPFYFFKLNDLDAISYRQEVMEDLQDEALMKVVVSFCGQMQLMRARLVDLEKLRDYKRAVERRFLGAVEIYCEAVDDLRQRLASIRLRSRGMRAFSDYITGYVASDSFRGISAELGELRTLISSIRYGVLLKDGAISVRSYNSDTDYSDAIERTFAKFRQRADMNYSVESRRWGGMNHIEIQILDRVAMLYPETFRTLAAFYEVHRDYVDNKISRFDREIQFYVAYLSYVDKLERAGLSFCRPQLSQDVKEISGRNAFDLALASKLVAERGTVVPNDFASVRQERIFVVTGPNQGGKTTFARMLGQLHYLACLGCLVPGTEARLFLVDRLFTHFEQEEHLKSLRGKLQVDLVRIRQILDHATSNSFIVMNEMFSSTTLKDAIYLSKKVIARMSELDLLAVWVTFLDELASFNGKTVSVVGTVDPRNPSERTYKLERRPADGLAYALAIAQKYRVTYDSLKERIKI